MRGAAILMKTVGPGGRGRLRGCMRISCGMRLPLRRLQEAQEATMFSQTDSPPRLRGITWSTVRPGLVGAAVLADPAVAGEHGLAGDAAPVNVAGDPDEADQPDHLGLVERASSPSAAHPSPFSSISAFSFRIRISARLVVQTLSGS